MCRLSWNLGASTSWNPLGLSRPVMGLLYPFLIQTSGGRDNSFGIFVHPGLQWKLTAPLSQIHFLIIRPTALLYFNSCLVCLISKAVKTTWVQGNIFKLQFVARYDSTSTHPPRWHRGKLFRPALRLCHSGQLDLNWHIMAAVHSAFAQALNTEETFVPTREFNVNMSCREYYNISIIFRHSNPFLFN